MSCDPNDLRIGVLRLGEAADPEVQIRVHPDNRYHIDAYLLDRRQDGLPALLLAQNVALMAGDERSVSLFKLYFCCDDDRELFYWPVRQMQDSLECTSAAFQFAEAQREWLRLFVSDYDGSIYSKPGLNDDWLPRWPKADPFDLVKVAFSGRVVWSPNDDRVAHIDIQLG